MPRYYILLLLLFCSCSNGYKTLSYDASNQKLPFIKEYRNGSRSVLVYGSYHTNNPDDEEITDIEQAFKKFNPEIVLYEGDNIGIENTKSESISNYFEMGMVRWLAKQSNTPDLNIEPETIYLTNQLLKKYTSDEVLLATILGQNMIYIKQHTIGEFEELYPVFIRDIETSGLQLTEGQKTIAHFYKLYKDFYGYTFDPETFDYRTVEIAYNKTKINEIVRHSASLRDQHMLHLVDSCLNHYSKIYIQVGGRHAIVWQPAFKRIIKH